MDPTHIDRLRRLFGNRKEVFLTDEDLKRAHNSKTWEETGQGAESRVYKTLEGGNIVKQMLENTDTRSNSSSSDSSTEYSPSIGVERFNRFSLELGLPKSPYLTTTISVSSTYSIELTRGPDLETYIQKNEPPRVIDRLRMCKNIYEGLSILHNIGRVCHLDIKPDNIFMNTSTLSIGDFGSITSLVSDDKGSTHGWRPPSISTKRGVNIDMLSSALVCIGIISWNNSIIFQCHTFVKALNNSPNLDQMCTVLRGFFQDECMQVFQKLSENMTPFANNLRCSMIGEECDTDCNIDTYTAILSIESSIEQMILSGNF